MELINQSIIYLSQDMVHDICIQFCIDRNHQANKHLR